MSAPAETAGEALKRLACVDPAAVQRFSVAPVVPADAMLGEALEDLDPRAA